MLRNINLRHQAMLGICLIALLLIMLTFAYSLMQWREDWALSHQKKVAPVASMHSNQTAEMIAAIPNHHLFGKSFSTPSKMPISNLQLRLTGIVKFDSKTGQHSKAYISLAGKPAKIYQVGDQLPYGVRIYDITEHAVILENNDGLEQLPLPRQLLQFKPHAIKESLA